MIIDILALSISGYIFIVPGLLLYFMYLKKSGKQQTPHHIVIAFIFCYYIIGILTMTGISSFKEFAPRIVLIPFVDMIRGPLDTILNVILFFPLGMFLPLLYKKYNRIGRIALTSFLLSLSIECFLQALFGEKCKIFLENVASPNWRKLQGLGWQLFCQLHSHCRPYLVVIA